MISLKIDQPNLSPYHNQLIDTSNYFANYQKSKVVPLGGQIKNEAIPTDSLVSYPFENSLKRNTINVT